MKEDRFARIDHVALAMPVGHENSARSFYCGILGMRELEKPRELSARGGAWFQSGEVQIHLGVDPHFAPAKKAHPAIRVRAYDEFVSSLEAADIRIQTDGVFADGGRHCYLDDPFGNRLEFIEVV
jgi:catechol 2,3-dioxygenase-like lactoylglutathione lyase family enzyme